MKIKHKAFTLVEVLISCAIFSIVALAIYSSFTTGVMSSRNVEENIELYQPVNKFMNLINKDLRNSFVFSNNTTNFSGNDNQISFMTVTEQYYDDTTSPVYSFVSYFFENNTISRLVRKGKDSLNADSEILPRNVLTEVESLNFEYGIFDNQTILAWNNTWDQAGKFPQTVKIKLVMSKNANKEFNRTVYLLNGLEKIENAETQ